MHMTLVALLLFDDYIIQAEVTIFWKFLKNIVVFNPHANLTRESSSIYGVVSLKIAF